MTDKQIDEALEAKHDLVWFVTIAKDWYRSVADREPPKRVTEKADNIRQALERRRVPEEHVKTARRCLHAMSGSSTEKATIERVLEALAASPDAD